VIALILAVALATVNGPVPAASIEIHTSEIMFDAEHDVLPW
jgi:hypothetical protein